LAFALLWLSTSALAQGPPEDVMPRGRALGFVSEP